MSINSRLLQSIFLLYLEQKLENKIINRVKTSTTLINTYRKWIKKVLGEFKSTFSGLALHDRLLINTHFIGLLELEGNV